MLEWFLACKWAGLDWFSDFDQLDSDDAAFVVAAYRTNQMIEAVTSYFQSRKK